MNQATRIADQFLAVLDEHGPAIPFTYLEGAAEAIGVNPRGDIDLTIETPSGRVSLLVSVNQDVADAAMVVQETTTVAHVCATPREVVMCFGWLRGCPVYHAPLLTHPKQAADGDRWAAVLVTRKTAALAVTA